MKNLHIKKKSSFSKILSLLIAVVMLLTLPGLSALADADAGASSVADSTPAAADTAAPALVGNADPAAEVPAVQDGYYRIYYSQIEQVNIADTSFSDANTKWNSINDKGNVYVNVNGKVAQMSDTGLTLTTNDNQKYKVYYYDIPVDTQSLFFLCDNTVATTNIKTRTNDVTLSWNSSGQISSYTTEISKNNPETRSADLTSNNCFYASNPNGSDWFYQVKSTNFNPVSKIELANTAVATGDKATISAAITPSWIQASDLIWSTENSDVADIASGGVVTGRKDGTAKITAAYGNVSASCQVTVSTAPSISIAPHPASVSVGNTMTFTATITPDQYKNSNITWSVGDTSIAELVANGVVKGLKKGKTEVTASFTTADGKTCSASADLTVTDPSGPVKRSSRRAATATQAPSITKKAESTKSATLYYLAPVAWPGVWVYFYTDKEHSYNTVPDAAMTKLDASDYLVNDEDINTKDYALYSITVPEKNAEYAMFVSESGKWTSDQDPASGKTGRPTAPDSKNGYYNKIENAVLVTRKVPASLSVTPDAKTIASDQTVQLTATANYKDGTSKDVSGTVTWQSSAQSTATVSSSGLVTAVQEGTVKITATVPGSTVSNTAIITVKDVEPTGLWLTPSSPVSLLAGTTATLTPSFKPDNVNASGVKLKWISNNEKVATVDADGVVTAVSAGKAKITATMESDNTVQAQATVTVSKDDSRIYYYAALSKLSYEGTPGDKNVDGPRSIPVANDTVYAYAWNNSDTTGGKLITMKKLDETSGNGITYAKGDIYYTDEAAGYKYIAFANGDEIKKNGALNLYGYGQGTIATQ